MPSKLVSRIFGAFLFSAVGLAALYFDFYVIFCLCGFFFLSISYSFVWSFEQETKTVFLTEKQTVNNAHSKPEILINYCVYSDSFIPDYQADKSSQTIINQEVGTVFFIRANVNLSNN